MREGVEPSSLEVVLDDGEAALDWVVLRRPGNVEDHPQISRPLPEGGVE